MDLAKLIDHTLLRADATEAEIALLCEEAAEYKFFSVCVNPYWVAYAVNALEGSNVKVCTVAGFPLGATPAAVKRWEAQRSVNDGAAEVDMVLNVGALKSGLISDVEVDVATTAEMVHLAGGRLKVILETCLLNDVEKELACRICMTAGADFVKTSTGFSKGGATVEDIRLMRRIVGDKLGVKASGGVRSYDDAVKMVEAGATRIGASASIAIVKGASASGGGY
ncbi:deoxyribose-phosphate aldolase [Bryobacter aggregatus]|uniref:deoxyribose-phosphate aldolase n=1 Tax=Bryobacter aggregatus TaxID=360054 RepID=UPI0004E0B3F1